MEGANPQEEETGNEAMIEDSEVPGADVKMTSSDELSDIEKDLDATGNMELDAGLE